MIAEGQSNQEADMYIQQEANLQNGDSDSEAVSENFEKLSNKVLE